MVASAICQNDAVLHAWQDGSCDIAVLPFPIDGTKPFMRENLFVCVPKDHALATHKSLTFADINGFNFLLRTELGFWDALCREKMPASKFWYIQIMLCLTNWFGLPRCRALARIMEIFRAAIRRGSISRCKMPRHISRSTLQNGSNRRRRPSFSAGLRRHRYLPVILLSFSLISCGVPLATIRPPASPPPGPMSIT